MFERLALSRLAGALAGHAVARQGLVAENVANADTPGYRARDVRPFSEMVEDAGFGLRTTRSDHMSDAPGTGEGRTTERTAQPSPNGNTVSLETEMVAAAETRQSHDLALAVYRSAGSIVRASLGRAG